jgi:hypothetical protein
MSDHHCPAHDLYTPTCAPCRVLTLTAELAGSDEELRRSQAALATAVREREEARGSAERWRAAAENFTAAANRAREREAAAVMDLEAARRALGEIAALGLDVAERNHAAARWRMFEIARAHLPAPAPPPAAGACGERLPDPRVDREALVAFARSVREPTGPLAGAAPAPPAADRLCGAQSGEKTCVLADGHEGLHLHGWSGGLPPAPARDPGGAR